MRKRVNYIIMLNLFLLNENITNGFMSIFLNITSIVAIVCGIFVIISKNPIVSVLFLIGLFISISGYLMLLGMNFIGLSYLLVYIGAVSILFLFILMLINVRISELVTNTSNSIPLAIFIGIIFNYAIIQILPASKTNLISNSLTNINWPDNFDINNINYYVTNIYSYSAQRENVNFVSSSLWDGNLSETNHITTLGNVLYIAYPMWLIITSIILLLAMVGAIIITIKQKN